MEVIRNSGIQTFLYTSTNLEILNLSNCSLTSEAMEKLFSETLAKKIQLIELRISHNQIRSDGANALAKYLRSYNQLEVLEIKGCEIEE